MHVRLFLPIRQGAASEAYAGEVNPYSKYIRRTTRWFFFSGSGRSGCFGFPASEFGGGVDRVVRCVEMWGPNLFSRWVQFTSSMPHLVSITPIWL